MAAKSPRVLVICASLIALVGAGGAAYLFVPPGALQGLAAVGQHSERDSRLYNAYVLGQLLSRLSFLKLIQTSGRDDVMSARELKALIEGLTVKAQGRAHALGVDLDVAALDLTPIDHDSMEGMPGVAFVANAIAEAQSNAESTALILGQQEETYFYLATADHLPASTDPLGLRGQLTSAFATGKSIGFPDADFPSSDAATVKTKLRDYDREVFHRFGS
jgi:hypothetical protein